MAGEAATVATAAAAGQITPMGWLMAGSSVLGNALRPGGAGPSSANSLFQNEAVFDNSGWTVGLGGSNVSATATQDKSGNGLGGSAGIPEASDLASRYIPYLLIAFGIVGLVKVLRK